MNKREALNKGIYYVATRLHSTMPVGRLMQKGLRKRYLAAETCTTTGPPTRERFRLLLCPPSYIMLCSQFVFHILVYIVPVMFHFYHISCRHHVLKGFL